MICPVCEYFHQDAQCPFFAARQSYHRFASTPAQNIDRLTVKLTPNTHATTPDRTHQTRMKYLPRQHTAQPATLFTPDAPRHLTIFAPL